MSDAVDIGVVVRGPCHERHVPLMDFMLPPVVASSLREHVNDPESHSDLSSRSNQVARYNQILSPVVSHVPVC